ncbi:hypothetical protein V5F77_28340 [Xanthobacter sp. DSM 24535]|uniref:hypothetical protein n=1 Tax=Roseixanthobacter psychrophilus TaxID=3119917 RepID=UPI00372830E4
MADDGEDVPVAARLDPQDAEPVLGIVEGNALDQARQNFRRLSIGLGFHEWGPRLAARQSHGISKGPDQMFFPAVRALSSSAM